MGRGDKKSAKGKRTIGSFGVSRSRTATKAKLKRTASKKTTKAVAAPVAKVKKVAVPRKKAE
jgi:ribosomal small subunit protein bTHX